MKCIICKYNDIGEYGNNADPVKEGRCCDWCNARYVIPARLRVLTDKDNEA